MNKLNNKQLVFFGFNFVVGFGFIATMTSLVQNKGWGILIFIIASFIALTVALSFSKLAHKYPETVGGSYAYSKEVFNKPFQFFIGWNQFIQGLLISSTSPLFFATIMKEFDSNSSHEIYYILVSLFIFSLIVTVTTFGLKTSKFVIFVSSILKYLVIFGAILLLVINIFIGINQATINPDLGSKDTIAKPSVLFASIISFIIAFGGIETVASISKDTEVKNFRKTLLFIFGLILIFYFIVYILFIFQPKTLGTTTFIGLYKSSLGLTGLILFGIGMFFNRLSATSSFIFGLSRSFVALSLDGFVPAIYSKKNKHGEYRNAILLFGLLNLITMFAIGLLPKLLSSNSNVQNIFDTLLDAVAIFFLIQYFFTIIIALLLHRKKEIKIDLWEFILYVIGLIIIVICLISYIFPIIYNIFPLKSPETWQVKNTIIVVSYLLINIIGYIWWYLYTIYKDKKELKNSKQKNINNETD
ncbi:APC family permease [Mycoplasma crocodyli]|uniref:Putative amino acid permease n=1 Tax=Mycoplasma crocodyli (strain ATCC 51981 / MP145) TaxID=512564 RepID=D5E503_MYCCM|nr:APC family permease [Mycoplasma crocodyli]ADE19647.1 putative amino acid permease [Mycoplasma crocodyli MP145]